MEFYHKHLNQLEVSLNHLEQEQSPLFSTADKAIVQCSEILKLFRNRVVEHGFQNEQTECLFFKTVKSQIVGYLFYFMNLIQIERSRPYGCSKKERKFYRAQIKVLQAYLWENQEFYEYYVRGLTDRDLDYFVRRNLCVKIHYDAIPSLMDHQFSTTQDMVLGKILGNLKTIQYLERKLLQVHPLSPQGKTSAANPVLKWTGSKADLVELTYALQSSGLVNNGNVAIKELAKAIETLFAVEIGDYYRIFLEIRARKTHQAKLLDLLKTSLINKIIEADG